MKQPLISWIPQPSSKTIAWLCLLAIVLLPTALTKLWDTDAWLHLAAGRTFAAWGGLPSEDPFSFTGTGRIWHTPEWLFESAMYAAYRLAGFPGVALFKTLLLLLTVFLLQRLCARLSGSDAAGTVLSCLFILASYRRFAARPELVNFLFLAIILLVLVEHRRGNDHLLWLPFLQILWVNSHQSWVLPFLLVGLAALADILSGRRKPAVQLLVCGVLLLLASWINPHGFRGLLYHAQAGRTPLAQQFIGEWHPMRWRHLAGGYGILLLLGAASALAARRRIDRFLAGVAVVFTGMAFRYLRFIPLSAVALAVLIAACLPQVAGVVRPLLLRFPRLLRSSSATAAAAVAACMLIAAPAVRSSRPNWGLDVKTETVPVPLADFLDHAGIIGGGFNPYDWGGYLLWRGFPRRSVFVDSRADVYGDAFLSDYNRAMLTPGGWEQAVTRYRFSYAVLSYPFHLHSASKYRIEKPGWVVVYWDDQGYILVKEMGPYRRLIDGFGFRFIQPDNPLFSGIPLKDKATAAGIEAEMARHIEQTHGGTARGYLLLGNFHLKRGEQEKARRAFEKSLAIRRLQPSVLNQLAILCVEAGNLARARDLLREAVRLARPPSAEIYRNLGVVYAKMGHPTRAEKYFRKAARLDPERFEVGH